MAYLLVCSAHGHSDRRAAYRACRRGYRRPQAMALLTLNHPDPPVTAPNGGKGRPTRQGCQSGWFTGTDRMGRAAFRLVSCDRGRPGPRRDRGLQDAELARPVNEFGAVLGSEPPHGDAEMVFHRALADVHLACDLRVGGPPATSLTTSSSL